MTKLFLTTALLIVGLNLSQAQEMEGKKRVHLIGVSTGQTQGSGFSYRYQPSRFAIQIVALPIFLKENRSYFSTGLSLFYTLESSSRFELLAYVSNSYNFANFTEDDLWTNPESNPFSTYNNPIGIIGFDPGYHASMGFGGNIHLMENKFILSAQFGYGIMNIDANPRSVFSGSIGAFFKF